MEEKYYHWLVRITADLILPFKHNAIDPSFNQAYIIAAKTAEEARIEGTRRARSLAAKFKLNVKFFDVDATRRDLIVSSVDRTERSKK